jgi:pimeloyl-ACP methyl ester carboxylesterase
MAAMLENMYQASKNGLDRAFSSFKHLSTLNQVIVGTAVGSSTVIGLSVLYYHRCIQRHRALVPQKMPDDVCEQMILPDGRTFGYLLPEKFEPTHPVIIYIHGTPESASCSPDFFEDLHKKVNEKCGQVQYVYIDRWGVGLTQIHQEAKIASIAGDILALCDHLGVDQFMVDSASGGGPYAAACAAKLPAKRCIGVVMQVPMGPRDSPAFQAAFRGNRWLFNAPWWCRWVLPLMQKYAYDTTTTTYTKEEFVRMNEQSLEYLRQEGWCEHDITAFVELLPALYDSYGKNQHFRHGIAAMLSEIDLLQEKNFGFSPSEITGAIPCHILIGDKDVHTPIGLSKWYVEQSKGNITLKVLEGRGHISYLTHPDFANDYVSFVDKCMKTAQSNR